MYLRWEYMPKIEIFKRAFFVFFGGLLALFSCDGGKHSSDADLRVCMYVDHDTIRRRTIFFVIIAVVVVVSEAAVSSLVFVFAEDGVCSVYIYYHTDCCCRLSVGRVFCQMREFPILLKKKMNIEKIRRNKPVTLQTAVTGTLLSSRPEQSPSVD